MTTPRRYTPSSPLLAIEAASIGLVFDPPPPPTVETRDGVAVVPIRGALNSHEGPGAPDSYDAIRRRVEQALAGKPVAVVLAIDSPGGVVAGCMELADDIARMCAAAKVPVESYVDGQATSAAYAVACAGSRITIPPTGIVGSIGTITELVDVTALDAAMGIRVHLVASGDRKTDGNPHTPITDAAVSAVASHIAEMAEALFAFVAAHRPTTADAVRELRAAMLIGGNAVRAGLADDVGTLSSLVARLAGESAPTTFAGRFAKMEAAMKKSTASSATAPSSVARAAGTVPAARASTNAPSSISASRSPVMSRPTTPVLTARDRAVIEQTIGAEQARAILARHASSASSAITDADAARIEGMDRIMGTGPAAPAVYRTADGAMCFGAIDDRAEARRLAQGGGIPTQAPRTPAVERNDGRRLLEGMDRIMGTAAKSSPLRREGTEMVFGALSHEEARQAAQNGGVR